MSVPKIGLLGGSFDPPHWGHLMIAQDAWDQAGLDSVRFIPAAQNPHKPGAPRASAEHRLAMLQAALRGHSHFEILDYELRQPGPSYTWKTLAALRAAEPNSDFYWIIGQDHLEKLAQWARVEMLCQQMTFLCLRRPDAPAPRIPDIPGLRLQMLDGHLMQLSSTEIRHRIQTGMSIDFFVPPVVKVYLETHQLYRAT